VTSNHQPDSDVNGWFDAAELKNWSIKTESETGIEIERGKYIILAETIPPDGRWIVSGMEESEEGYRLAESDSDLQIERLHSRSEALGSIQTIAGLMNSRFFNSI
jgi:hypothetical protein